MAFVFFHRVLAFVFIKNHNDIRKRGLVLELGWLFSFSYFLNLICTKTF